MSKTIPTQEYELVVAAVQTYIDGLQCGDTKTLSRAFHNDAVMYGYSGDSLLGGPIENLYEFVRRHGAATQVKTHTDVLSITPTTAVVRVDMENDAAGLNYTDFHTLIKVDEHWCIIAKTFHQYD
ncbi:hypothetical protein P3T76_008183 [Phytophthora citrophthora]|uniref:Uncharacterized protein n=1 Tax=Phytophthora citrophthora TaxID=4793 RepID=A0AAD9LLD8_9STRA|nr:hypothetical protein P3T76_008200 [Phytophthora citrophthora]KAK1939878.1 hypothetical protein P3T76_008201 [Phytophthora citrophthora]KAK1940731.1 hypothetical protein P3T76_008182 [Phytophthora citrophthora]KAK1940732.1 hypothetical protein P3T76_008183 [Phytophthora citrophthora]